LDSSNGGIFSIDDKLYIILEKNRFSDWFADGRLDAIDKAIIQKVFYLLIVFFVEILKYSITKSYKFENLRNLLK
jgi:hypothetical protein